MTASDSARRVAELVERGVQVVAPEQVFVAADVDLTRVAAGATLHPGTRLHGARTFVAAGAHVGKEGPATLDNAVLGKNASVASGYVRGAVLLDDAQLGFAAHVREGTLLEEQASTGHAVGLKQSILLSFATLGSLINFCDALIAGGTSRRDHSEIGSGFIHFNFTPWGEHGDKATPSLIGDVVDGVFLDQPRIFLGGNSGLIGPRRVGYGSITAAGQVVRRDVGPGVLVFDPGRALDTPVRQPSTSHTQRVLGANAAYLGELVALRAWYRHVRLGRLSGGPEASGRRIVLEEAVATLDGCLDERWARLAAFLRERGIAAPRPDLAVDAPCPIPLDAGGPEHLTWVASLPRDRRAAAAAWLRQIAQAVVASVTALA